MASRSQGLLVLGSGPGDFLPGPLGLLEGAPNPFRSLLHEAGQRLEEKLVENDGEDDEVNRLEHKREVEINDPRVMFCFNLCGLAHERQAGEQQAHHPGSSPMRPDPVHRLPP